MADINDYSPRGGSIVGADNQLYNVVDLLGGGTPVDDKLYDITQFQPTSGLIIGSDNRMYDLVALLINIANKENAGIISDEQIINAVTAYLSEHPVQAGATAEQAEQIEANKQAIEELRQSGTGTPGADGQDGEDGVSPTVTVEAIEGGHRVTVTDANGTQSFDVMDGVDGQDGAGGSGSSVELDTTLTQSGKAADAKAVGDKFTELNSAKANDADLAPVAKSGSYNDLADKPTIPTAYTLPNASASVLGGVKVGTGLTIDANGVLSLNVSNASGVSF